MRQSHILIPQFLFGSNLEVIILSEDKKKMYYYYGGKEKKAGELKKSEQGMTPYDDFDRMMDRFEKEFNDFWGIQPRWTQWMRGMPRFPMMPRHMMMAQVDVEDRGKDYRVTADLPGFNKDDVNIEISDDMVMIHAKKTATEEETKKNYVRKERMAQTFYRRIDLPETVKSDDAKASLTNGILEIVLPKKEPKETKKLKPT
jgi:HSP20 family protein